MENLTIEQLQKQLEEAKRQAYEAQQEAAAAAAERDELAEQIKSGKGKVAIKGEYKGHRFADGHLRVRDQRGAICDTEKLLAAANDKNSDGHAEAVAILDWLIQTKYGYFKKT